MREQYLKYGTNLCEGETDGSSHCLVDFHCNLRLCLRNRTSLGGSIGSLSFIVVLGDGSRINIVELHRLRTRNFL